MCRWSTIVGQEEWGGRYKWNFIGGIFRDSNSLFTFSGSPIYYVIATGQEETSTQTDLEYIGDIDGSTRRGNTRPGILNFKYDRECQHLILERSSTPDDDDQESTIQYILYNQKTYTNLVEGSYQDTDDCELVNLARFVNAGKGSNSRCRTLSVRIVDKTVDVITRILNYLSFVLLPLNWAFKSSAVAQHFREWQIIFKAGGRRHSM